MIFALIGQSSSGKSTIESMLVDLGYSKIVSYTTRPMRKGEKDGVDYHFVDHPTFEALAQKGFFTETAQYRDWHYGLSLNGIDYKNKDYIVVVTISGYMELRKAVGKENIVAIHIKVDERERIIRQLKRGDDVDEVIRRIYADRKDFSGVEDICDFTVLNEKIEKTVEDVKALIWGIKITKHIVEDISKRKRSI